MGLLRSLVLGVVLAYITHVFYSETVPHGVMEPIKVRIVLVGNRILFHAAWVLDYTCIVRDVTMRRFFVNTFTAMTNQRIDGVQLKDAMFAGVPVRVYIPADRIHNGSGLVFYHGGGWIVGNIDSYDSVAAFMAKESNMVVVSVEYRLNPEHSHKDGLEDCLKATRYFLANAAQYEVDGTRVGVAGDSAGGNYAAVVALQLRDEAFKPAVKLQLLIYPSVQAIDLMLPSYQQYSEGPFINKHDMCWAKSYLAFKSNEYIHHFESNNHVSGDVRAIMATGVLNHDIIPEQNKYSPYRPPDYPQGKSDIWEDIKSRYLDPYHYPLMAKNHSNLPETYIFTAHFDQLRDDGYLYAHKLTKDGTKVTHVNCPHCWHGMFNFMQPFQYSRDMMKEMLLFTKDTL